MAYRHPLAWGFALLGAVAPAAAPAAAQAQAGAADGWTVPRTAAGHPDLQGIWANDSATPLERPEGFENRPVLTEEEFAEFQERAEELTSESADAGFLDEVFLAAAGGAEEFETFCTGTGNYNNFWLTERHFENRTSLVTDPPTGRIPYRPETQQLLAAQLESFAGGEPAASWEELGVLTRCITNGVPNLLPGYNTNYQFVQTADHVLILQELMHEARVIPLDGRPHLASDIRQVLGDSRGRWEGDTLVVTTANFTDKTSIQGSSENARLIERFTRVGPDTLHYEFTVEDDTRFTSSWTALIPMQKIAGPIFEYACHEGNYGLIGILAGARADEAAAAAAR